MHLHIVGLVYILSLVGCNFMVYAFIIVFMITYSCFMILPGFVPVLSISWVWHPRDCVREAYKRIGHAEISNFLNNILKSKLIWKSIRSNLLSFLYLFKNMTFCHFKYLTTFK